MDITFLQIVLYVLGAVLMVCLIVLIIKTIYTVNRINFLLDDVQRKLKAVDRVFVAANHLADTVSLATDKIGSGLMNFVSKIFKKGKKEREEK